MDVFPIIYAIFALVKGYVFEIPIPNQPQSPFPYFFFNVHEHGWRTVGLYILGIAIFYIALGLFYYSVKMINVKRKIVEE